MKGTLSRFTSLLSSMGITGLCTRSRWTLVPSTLTNSAPASAVPTPCKIVGGSTQRTDISGQLFGRSGYQHVKEKRHQSSLTHTGQQHADYHHEGAPVVTD